MTAASPTIADLFESFAPVGNTPRSRWDREAELIDRHTKVARHHADATFLRLVSEPDVVDRTITAQVLGERFEMALDDLIAESAKVCERHGFTHAMTRLQGEGRLISSYRKRIDELASSFQRGSA